jgi:HlyD family secretion protein
MRKIVIAVVLVAAVLGVGGWVYMTYLAPQPETETPSEPVEEPTRVVSATGVVLPLRWATLSFKMAAQVEQVLVQQGDQVEEGQVLVQLDTRDLEEGVAQAQAALATAQATLAQVEAGPRPEELAAAQAGLAAAEAQLASLKAGATPEQITAAKGSMETASFALEQAQAAYDEVSWLNNRKELPQALALQQASTEYEIARANYEAVLRGPSTEEIAAAQAEVDGTRASLDLLRAGASAEQVAVAQSQVAQAELNLSQALAAVQDADLSAPFAGTVGSLRVREGEMVSAGAPVVTLGDVSEFEVETTDLNEIDLYLVREGQLVDLTFDALPGKSIQGVVTRIAPMADLEQGGTNYTLTIELQEQDPALRWGMTAFVDIVVAAD